MQITFLANCGILLQAEHDSILVDAPNSLHTSFDGLPEEEFQKIVLAQSPYDSLKAMFFTHRHNDHYDKKRARCIMQTRQDVESYSPNGVTPKEGTVKAGEFTVHYFLAPHSGEEFSQVPHCVLLVEAKGKRIYITGDADWNAKTHGRILRDFSPHVAVWNPNYMTHPKGRALLAKVPQNFIYHLPLQTEDVFGFARKCRKDYGTFGKELPVTLVDYVPATAQI